MNIKTNYFALFIIMTTLIFSCNTDDQTEEPTAQIETPEDYSLVWSDEFNSSSIDMANWQYETGDGSDYGLPSGWGNNELQIYTESGANSGIENDDDLSVLYIRAVSDGADNFTSARLTSKNLFSMRFGRVDIKAKMPEGQGIWAAIWMLGDNINQVSWPGCGEIDIVELLGHEPDKMYSTLHFTDSEHSHGTLSDSYALSNGTFSDSYHIFSMDWTPDNLTFSIDGMRVQQVPIEDDMKEFLRSFYLLLNVAVGGNWPGSPDNTTSFPQTMRLDYIRVFEKNEFTAPLAPTLDIDEESIGQNIESSPAQYAIKDGFDDLGNVSVIACCGGGEPLVAESEIAIDGDSSLVLSFPGGNWGGGYFVLEAPVDLSGYNYIKFALNKPSTVVNAEIKLESPSTNAAIFLTDYTGVDVGQGFQEYSIPLSDFLGLDLTQISIPFSMWNPIDAGQNFAEGTAFIDRVYFCE